MNTSYNLSRYSCAQMDNFYQAFAAGAVKPTSVMNFMQHLVIAQGCRPDDWVLDVCCGRALQVPILKSVAPDIGGYLGLDISTENIQEASQVIRYGDGLPPSFSCQFVQGDATVDLTRLNRLFDVIAYTSALEHMEKEAGRASLQQVALVLHPQGTFYLSTPNTPGGLGPKKLQHPRAHVYEWNRHEVEEELTRIGLTITDCYGLLSPDAALITETLKTRFGSGASAWFEEMRKSVPSPFLGPLVASALPEIATELLYVCRRPEEREG